MGGMQLSVVIAAHNAAAVISSCLAALGAQLGNVALEIIVADSSTDATPEIVGTRFPGVRLLHFEEPLTIPALRGRGIAAAEGTVIAILDPFSVAAPDWATQVMSAHGRQHHLVVGGAVDLYRAASASYATWARYLNEYGLFMSPVVRGVTWILPGSNVSYKRSALFDGLTPRYPVFWKTHANQVIESAGSALWLEPDVRVELNKPIPFSDFLRTRYHHGRCFAGMRVHGGSWTTRGVRAVSVVLVPLVLMGRWTRGFWPKRRRRMRFVATIPAQLALFSVWAWGEAWGYLRGTGRSCGQLFY
jgi:glycosyltransferase involved in cell wall biosynthesis